MRKTRERRYFNAGLERLSRSELEALQFRKLKAQLEYVYASNPFHRAKWERIGLTPDDIKTRDDFRLRVPFSDKQEHLDDQQEHPPYGRRLGVGREKLASHMLTAGTSGLGQEVYGFTPFDLEITGFDVATTFAWNGWETGDRVFGFMPLGFSLAGWGPLWGAQKLGLTWYQVDPLQTEQRLQFMQRFGVDGVFFCTPSFLTRMAVVAETMGIDVASAFPTLKSIAIGAESYPIEWIQRMEELWDTWLCEFYGAMPYGFTAGVCEQGSHVAGRRGGMHVVEHAVYVEVLRPGTDEPVEPGERGEIVVTQLNREASPVVRYRSKDSAVFVPHTACTCGRPYFMLECGTIGRYDDMMKIRGNNVWPMVVDDTLFSHPEVAEYRGKVGIGGDGKDEVTIQIALRPGVQKQPIEERRRLLDALKDHLKRVINITVAVEEVPSLPDFEYKARRWSDERHADLGSIGQRLGSKAGGQR